MLKAGIIGLGVGEAHIEGYLKHPQCVVSWVCDFSMDKLNDIKKKYPHIHTTNDANELLKNPDIDIVSIASYDNFHYEQVASAIKNHKHIFVEKPLCLYEKEAMNIKKLLDKNPDIKMSCNLILRKYPRFLSLKDMIQKNKLGDLYCIEGDYNYGRIHKITEGWRGKLSYYSIILGGGIHLIDLFHWLTQKKIIKVSAFGNNIATKNSQFKYNDVIICSLKFNDGTVGKLTVNYSCVYPHFHNLTVYGTKGTFVNERNHTLIYYSRDPEEHPHKLSAPYPGVDKGGLLYNFVESIIGNKEPKINKKEIFDAMAVCFAIDNACNTEKAVNVRYF